MATMLFVLAPTPASAELKPDPGPGIGSPGTVVGALLEPNGVGFTSVGNIWVADSGNSRVQQFTPTGASVVQPIPFQRPVGLAVAPDDSVYVTDASAGQVVHILADGTVDASFDGSGWLEPVAVAVDPSGDTIYVAERSAGRVRSASAATGAVSGVIRVGLLEPSGVAVDASGAIAISDAAASRVEILNASGTPQASADASTAGLAAPLGLTFDPYGRVVVADSANDRIVLLSATGAVVDQLGGMRTPAAVASDGVDRFAVSERAAGHVTLPRDDLPPPQFAETTNVASLRGQITFRQTPTGPFVRLQNPVQLRFGAEIESSGGAVRIVTENRNGTLQQATLSEGRFVVRQPATGPSGVAGVVQARLSGTGLESCPRRRRVAAAAVAVAAAAKPRRGRKVRRVRTKVKGSMITAGEHATGTVVSTDYRVTDYCNGTLVEVFSGVVRVRGDRESTGRNVRAGGRRFVAAPTR